MTIPRTTRRGFLAAAGISSLALAGLTGCGTSGPGTTSGGGGGDAGAGATMWGLSGQPNEKIYKDSVDAFNSASSGGKIDLTFFQNDAYKQKIRTAVGADQAPTLIYGWGGGILKSYADAGQVEDLTSWLNENAGVKDRYIDSVWKAATIEDKIYAIPAGATQPVVFYYNKELFSQAGVEPPKTWDDVMKLVETFNSKGIAPFSLGGQSKWTSMMWLEYLLDRIGGPEVFNDKIFANKADAWSDPAVIQTCEKVQELVKAGGFIKGFSSVAADGNADLALLTSGKAAMLVQGGWVYGAMKSMDAKFVSEKLGWAPFPTIPGGKGDPNNAVGNPCNYYSISAKAADGAKTTAKDYVSKNLMSEEMQKQFVANGSMPVIKGADALAATSPDQAFLQFVYDLLSNAKDFTQSWDQALSPAQSEALLTNIDKLFLLQITPQDFATAMNATIGK